MRRCRQSGKSTVTREFLSRNGSPRRVGHTLRARGSSNEMARRRRGGENIECIGRPVMAERRNGYDVG